MKKGILLTFIFFSFFLIINSQDKKITKRELSKHNLNWIEAQSKFCQSSLSVEKIDAKISDILVKSKRKKTKVKDIVVPFNSKKLTFVGYKHPNDLGIFDAWKVSSKNSASINKKLYIYKYGDFYISQEKDDEISQKNVFYTIRAIIILESHFSNAYKKLITDTKKHISQHPGFAKWSNSNKCFWIAYNETPDYIAKSQTSFLGNGFFSESNEQIGDYKNIPIIDIHSENIKGLNKGNGSFPIYKRNSSTANYLMYMKEGLLETLIHEMLHRYIDYAYTHSDTFNKIKAFRSDKVYLKAEECVVMNTTLSYFKNKALFSSEIFDYYTPIFNDNITELKTKNIYKKYSELIKPWSEENINFPRKVFKLDLLEQ